MREPSLLWTGACSRKPDKTKKLKEVGEAPGGGGGGGGEGRGAQQPSRSGNQGSPNDCVSPCLIQFLKKEMVRRFGLLLIHLGFQSRWANFG